MTAVFIYTLCEQPASGKLSAAGINQKDQIPAESQNPADIGSICGSFRPFERFGIPVSILETFIDPGDGGG